LLTAPVQSRHGLIFSVILPGNVINHYFALILFPFASWVTSASPNFSINGGIYIPNRPRSPFFNPYQPPTGFFSERPHASTVPSFAGFCSSALPSSIQSPFFLSIACKLSMHRASYNKTVLPTVQTKTSLPSFSSACIV